MVQASVQACDSLSVSRTYLDQGPDQETIPAMLFALQWCSQVLRGGRCAPHRQLAIAVASVVLRALIDGFHVVGEDGKAPALHWLPGDSEVAATLLADVDKVGASPQRLMVYILMCAFWGGDVDVDVAFTVATVRCLLWTDLCLVRP